MDSRLRGNDRGDGNDRGELSEMSDDSLEKLSSEINKAKRANESNIPGNADEPAGISPLRVGVELVAGVIVGTGLGLLADRWLGTSPLFFLAFFFLGILGSGLNIYRLAKSQKIVDKPGNQ